MPQPTKREQRLLSRRGFRTCDVDTFLNAFRALDRTVVEISMDLYNVPRRDRDAMLRQHRRLHDIMRKRLPRFLYPRRQANPSK